MATERTEQQRAAIGALKAERDLDKAAAMREYQAERLHIQANFARLRALRLARESAAAAAVAAARPAAKKKTPAKTKQPARGTAAVKPARRKTPA